jgi:HAAS
MSTDDDQLVEDYLRELRNAARVLPADRRDELVEEITAHIAEARQSDGSPMAVRNILDRLGDPADIVRAAGDTPPGSPAWSGAPGSGAGHPVAAAALPGRPGALELAAVLFLLLGGIVIPILGWVIGVVLLWLSPRWTTRDKLLGTLVWPGGLLAPALLLVAGAAAGLLAASETVCTSGPTAAPLGPGQQNVHQAATHCTTSGGVGLPPWLVITLGLILLILAVAGPIWTARRLLRRASESPAQPTPTPANLIPA